MSLSDCEMKSIDAQEVSGAILAAVATVRRDRLEDAAKEARRRGLMSAEEYKRIVKELKHGSAQT